MMAGKSYDLSSNLETQQSELEMLVAMYPDDTELELANPASIQDIQDYLDGTVKRVPNPVEFTLNLKQEELSTKVEVIIKLPTEYPESSLPEVYVRSDSLNRSEQARINKDLLTAVKEESLPKDPCVLLIIDWVQNHAADYISPQQQQLTTSQGVTESMAITSSGIFSRYWIYSHHIYSNTKRRDMLGLSKEFNLSGFVLPGKPGIICVEGDSKNVGDWWAIVRNWQWKRLSLRIQQDENTEEIEEQRKFKGFEEIGEVKGNTRDYHMDMKAFQVYLNEHGFGHLFGELFSL